MPQDTYSPSSFGEGVEEEGLLTEGEKLLVRKGGGELKESEGMTKSLNCSAFLILLFTRHGYCKGIFGAQKGDSLQRRSTLLVKIQHVWNRIFASFLLQIYMSRHERGSPSCSA